MNKLGISLLTLGFAGTALATGKSDYHNFKPDNFNQNKAYSDSFSKSNASVSGFKAISQGGKAIAHSQGGNAEGGIGHGGIGQGGIGQGGSIQPGAVQNRFQGGNTTISGVGNSDFNYPRQVAPIVQFGYGASSDDHCGASFGINGGSGGGNGGILFPWTEDHCKRLKASKHFMYVLNMPKTACHRFVNGDDDNEKAIKDSGELCSNVKQVTFAEPVPANQVIPVATPTLDQWWDSKNNEIDKKLDNAQRLGVMK